MQQAAQVGTSPTQQVRCPSSQISRIGSQLPSSHRSQGPQSSSSLHWASAIRVGTAAATPAIAPPKKPLITLRREKPNASDRVKASNLRSSIAVSS
jgi:hypothetical protein